MWYWDFAPPSGHHAKKPLTKAQIRKIQEAYNRADEITAEVEKREQEEQKVAQDETDKLLELL